MKKVLIIIESPNKIKTYNEIIAGRLDDNHNVLPFNPNNKGNQKILDLLGVDSYKEVEVVATVGHIKVLEHKNTKGFEIVKDGNVEKVVEYYDFTKTTMIKDKKRVITSSEPRTKALMAKIKEADEVYLATDNDAAGEQIAFEVMSCFKESFWKSKTWYRIRVVAIEAPALISALEKKKNYLNEDMLDNEQTRAICDLEIGFTLSPLIAAIIRKNAYEEPNEKLRQEKIQWLSANESYLMHTGTGRLKAPIIEMIREREELIANYKEKQWYTINPIIKSLTFKHIASELPYAIVNNANVIFDTLDDVKKAINTIQKEVKVTNKSDITHTTSARFKPITLSDISIVDSLSNGLKSLTDSAQILFEIGRTTYPRTKYRNVAENFIDAAMIELQGLLDKDPSTKNQVWTLKPEKKWITGTKENSKAELAKQHKKNTNNEEEASSHEAYRVTNILATNSMIFEDIIHHKYENNKDGATLRAILKENKEWIDTHDNLEELVKKYRNVSLILREFKNHILLYSFVRDCTRKFLTNAPEYDKCDVSVTSTSTNSDVFKVNLRNKTVMGYTYWDKSWKDIVETNEDDKDNEVDLNELTNDFKIGNTLLIENFDSLDTKVGNSIIKLRKTIKPKPISEKEIIDNLEKYGIGTTATRNNTISSLSSSERNVAQKDKDNRLTLTPYGNAVAINTKKYASDYCAYEFTSHFDEKLEAIENGTYTKLEMVKDLLDKMSQEPYKEYNWYTSGKYTNRFSKGEKVVVESNYKCWFCHNAMKDDGKSIYCDNPNCEYGYNEKYKRSWGFTKDSITSKICEEHKPFPYVNNKTTGKSMCVIERAMFFNKDKYGNQLKPKWEESKYICPICSHICVENDVSIACKNEDCPSFDKKWNQSWSFKKENLVKPLIMCEKGHNIPQVYSAKSGKPYCPVCIALLRK